MNCWGISMSLDLKECDAILIRSKEKMQDFVIQLCKLIDMKRYGDCLIEHFGTDDKEGFTIVQLIETSNIVMHVSNRTAAIYFDLFSCKEYQPQEVADFAQDYFQATKVKMKVQLRF